MKKAYEYLDEIEAVEFMQSDDIFYRNSIVEKLIKQVQIDTIKKTIKECADNADADVEFLGDLARESIKSGEPFLSEEDYEVFVVKSSILQVAEQLKKELE